MALVPPKPKEFDKTVPSLALPSDGVDKVPREPLSVGGLTAVVHLYRAEVGRMTAYRQRLDTTTNWAITSSTLVATFSLGNTAIPHAATSQTRRT